MSKKDFFKDKNNKKQQQNPQQYENALLAKQKIDQMTPVQISIAI